MDNQAAPKVIFRLTDQGRQVSKRTLMRAILALALPPAAEISPPLACSLYVLSISQFLHVFALPHWLGAALPVGGALALTGLCWQQGRCTGRLVLGDWHTYAQSDGETPPGGRSSVG